MSAIFKFNPLKMLYYLNTIVKIAKSDDNFASFLIESDFLHNLIDLY